MRSKTYFFRQEILSCLVMIILLSGAAGIFAADFSTFESRKAWLMGLEHDLRNLEKAKYGMPAMLAKIYTSDGTDAVAMEYAASALEKTTDEIFDPVGVIRTLYLYRDKFSDSQYVRIGAAAQKIVDWAGGGTENHQIMKWTNGYLLAQEFDGQWQAYYGVDDKYSSKQLMAMLKDKIIVEGKKQYERDCAE